MAPRLSMAPEHTHGRCGASHVAASDSVPWPARVRSRGSMPERAHESQARSNDAAGGKDSAHGPRAGRRAATRALALRPCTTIGGRVERLMVRAPGVHPLVDAAPGQSDRELRCLRSPASGGPLASSSSGERLTLSNTLLFSSSRSYARSRLPPDPPETSMEFCKKAPDPGSGPGPAAR